MADAYHLHVAKQPIELAAHSMGVFTAFVWKNAFLRLADALSGVGHDATDDDVRRVLFRTGLAVVMVVALGAVAALYDASDQRLCPCRNFKLLTTALCPLTDYMDG
jgi:hypothetical protein